MMPIASRFAVMSAGSLLGKLARKLFRRKPKNRFYILEGADPVPATEEEYTKWTMETHHLWSGNTELTRPSGESIWVQTRFVGINVYWMTFVSSSRGMSWCQHWATLEQAMRGHKQKVNQFRAQGASTFDPGFWRY